MPRTESAKQDLKATFIKPPRERSRNQETSKITRIAGESESYPWHQEGGAKSVKFIWEIPKNRKGSKKDPLPKEAGPQKGKRTWEEWLLWDWRVPGGSGS